MKLRQLSLRDFRNYESLELSLSPDINVFVGENAQGKTSILESVYLLSTGRSHRITDEKACIRHNQEFGLCKALIEGNHSFQLKVVIHPKGKTLFYQNQPLKKSSEFIGKMNAVIFSPSDLELFDSSPKARRRLIDVELGKINPFYMESLSRYYKVLKDRNAYLKEKSIDHAYLEVLTRQMIAYQLDLIRLKRVFIESLNQKIEHVYQRLSLSADTVSIQYLGPVETSDDMKGLLEAKYSRSLERDKVFKMTHVGVHRDDLDFRIDGQVVQSVASQGQKRMFVIALKCALLEVIEEISGEKPILLLDDVFSELDSKRKKALYEILHRSTQTLITTTDVEDVALWLQDRVSIYEVHQGKVSERSSVHE